MRDDKPIDRTAEGSEELELDLTPGTLDKTNDPVRMYLREMGTVPLLTREGEVEIARRIEAAEKKLGAGRVKFIHPDCGFWMLKRSVADRKIAALVKGRDLYLGRG